MLEVIVDWHYFGLGFRIELVDSVDTAESGGEEHWFLEGSD